jgi:hypothetical protein
VSEKKSLQILGLTRNKISENYRMLYTDSKVEKSRAEMGYTFGMNGER